MENYDHKVDSPKFVFRKFKFSYINYLNSIKELNMSPMWQEIWNGYHKIEAGKVFHWLRSHITLMKDMDSVFNIMSRCSQPLLTVATWHPNQLLASAGTHTHLENIFTATHT